SAPTDTTEDLPQEQRDVSTSLEPVRRALSCVLRGRAMCRAGSAGKASGVVDLPTRGVGACLGHGVLCLPPQVAGGGGRVGVAGGDVTGAALDDLEGDGDPGGFLEGAHTFQDGGAPPGTEVVHAAPVRVGQVGDCGQVAAGQVHHVQVVTDPGAVGGVVVVAEHFEVWTVPRGHLGDVGEQVVGHPLGVLPDEAAGVCTDRVEVTQGDDAPAGVGHCQVRQDLLDEQLRRAVGVGGGQPGVLGDRYPFGVSVDRGGRAEDQVTYPVFVHHLGEVQQRVEVVAVVTQGLAHRLAHGLEPGQVDDGVDLVLGEHLTQRGGVGAV